MRPLRGSDVSQRGWTRTGLNISPLKESHNPLSHPVCRYRIASICLYYADYVFNRRIHVSESANWQGEAGGWRVAVTRSQQNIWPRATENSVRSAVSSHPWRTDARTDRFRF